jgi:rod shape-determining protein MreC
MRNAGGFIGKHRNGLLLFIFVLVSLLLMGFSTRSVTFHPKNIGLTIFSVFQHGISAAAGFVADTVNSVGELRKLTREAERMRSRLQELEGVERQIVELRDENQRLRRLLGYSERIGYDHVTAEVIGRDPSNLFPTIVVGKGSRHDVHEDMPVVAYQDGVQGLVGIVSSVGLQSAIVMPITDRNCYVSARLHRTRYDGIVNGGAAGQTVVMQYVRKRAKSEVQYGDIVVTAGLRSLYPKGLFIGRVMSISAREYENSLRLEVLPAIDFSRLEHVFILDAGAE